MNVNLTKIARYQPLTKSKKGRAYIIAVAKEFNTSEELLMRKFTFFLGMLVKRHIQNAVKTQKISGKPMRMVYKPLSSKYKASKPKSTRDKFWINSGFLIENLKLWQLKNGDVFIGYRGNAVHKGKPYRRGSKRVKASDVMVYVERGTKKIPPRPLFTIIVRNIAKNISFYLEMFVNTIRQGYVKI